MRSAVKMADIKSQVLFVYFVACCFVSAFTHLNDLSQVRQICITSDNHYGVCVALIDCPEVVNLFQSGQFHQAQQQLSARQLNCGSPTANVKKLVCCLRAEGNCGPQQSNQIGTTEPAFVFPTTESTTVAITQPTTTTATPIIQPTGPSCRSPDQHTGVCIGIRSCPSLLSQLQQKPVPPTLITFLQASKRICGNVGTIVCCPTANTKTKSSSLTIPINTNQTPRRLPTPEEGCGYTSHSFGRIVGGVVSKIGAWPWVVLLGYKDELSSSPFKCGGTLVTARHVLTAAHCIRHDLSFVRLGEHDTTTDTETTHVDIPIANWVRHPEFQNGHSDIAILYLQHNAQFTDKISPICLPIAPNLRKKSYVDDMPFVVGWGRTMEIGPRSTELREVQVPILKNEVCKSSYNKVGRFHKANQFDAAVVCAGNLSGGKDSCRGDSGGPLMIPETFENSVRYYEIGVVSWGIGCAREGIPSIYASTQYFMDWITEKVKNTP